MDVLGLDRVRGTAPLPLAPARTVGLDPGRIGAAAWPPAEYRSIPRTTGLGRGGLPGNAAAPGRHRGRPGGGGTEARRPRRPRPAPPPEGGRGGAAAMRSGGSAADPAHAPHRERGVWIAVGPRHARRKA